MTREEKAIMYFKDMRKKFCEDYLLGIPKDSVAYKATMAEKEFYDTAIEALEQEPCEDAISREAALEKMADYVASGYADSAEDFEEYSRIICQLPPVRPQEPKYCDRNESQERSDKE